MTVQIWGDLPYCHSFVLLSSESLYSHTLMSLSCVTHKCHFLVSRHQCPASISINQLQSPFTSQWAEWKLEKTGDSWSVIAHNEHEHDVKSSYGSWKIKVFTYCRVGGPPRILVESRTNMRCAGAQPSLCRAASFAVGNNLAAMGRGQKIKQNESH